MTGFLIRFGAIVACSAYVYGLIELARFAGWPAALGVGVGGLAGAVLLAQDWDTVDVQPQRGHRRHSPWRRTKPYDGPQ